MKKKLQSTMAAITLTAITQVAFAAESSRTLVPLADPPDQRTLKELLGMLGLEPIDLIRRNEPPFKELGLDKHKGDRRALITAMVEHPVLIERPIVVKGNKARLGRPPENVLEIL